LEPLRGQADDASPHGPQLGPQTCNGTLVSLLHGSSFRGTSDTQHLAQQCTCTLLKPNTREAGRISQGFFLCGATSNVLQIRVKVRRFRRSFEPRCENVLRLGYSFWWQLENHNPEAPPAGRHAAGLLDPHRICLLSVPPLQYLFGFGARTQWCTSARLLGCSGTSGDVCWVWAKKNRRRNEGHANLASRLLHKRATM